MLSTLTFLNSTSHKVILRTFESLYIYHSSRIETLRNTFNSLTIENWSVLNPFTIVARVYKANFFCECGGFYEGVICNHIRLVWAWRDLVDSGSIQEYHLSNINLVVRKQEQVDRLDSFLRKVRYNGAETTDDFEFLSSAWATQPNDPDFGNDRARRIELD